MHDKITICPLQHATHHIDHLTRTLDHPDIVKYIIGGTLDETLHWRLQRDQSHETLHLVVLLDNTPIGWAGWTPYAENPTLIQTTTFLTPTSWGTGTNTKLKALQWQVCNQAGVPMVISAHNTNHRSHAAIRKLWPQAPHTETLEDNGRRHQTLYTITTPPNPFHQWDPDTVGTYANIVRNIPQHPTHTP